MLEVEEGGQKNTIGIAKLSGDFPNEIYFFTNDKDCIDYGDSFNNTVEIVFIRAPGSDKCYECRDCGVIQSVKFSSMPTPGELRMKIDTKSSAIRLSETMIICIVIFNLFIQ
ncbi:hypothetical protein Zmor_011931 [Zophobas morio]|uniref:Uncharacterized protein n=1 Tax=Zophobas morio TaxID=2755281 RepID=A0AA38HJG6_9CUCU|nr:hypothetical protein Zmor_011931 [Zophobas morio]